MRKTLLALALAAVPLSGCDCVGHLDRETYRATVTDKQVKRANTTDKYLVFTKLEDGSVRVFENTDSPVELKFNSSDVYAKIEVGKKYDIATYGFRLQFFSMYENILDVKEIK
jgi:Protein of unknown function (DUF1523)